jgi:hypothetical protein
LSASAIPWADGTSQVVGRPLIATRRRRPGSPLDAPPKFWHRGRHNKPQAFLYTVANGLFALEPQITNLPKSMNLKIDPWRINNGGQIIGLGPAGRPNVAYLLKPQ